VIGWTVLGAAVPGTGLIAAGRRRAGVTVLAVLLALAATLAVALSYGDLMDRALTLAVDPGKLLALAGAVAVTGLAWAGLIVLTAVHLHRRAALRGVQRLAGGLVATALVAACALPAYKVGSYALIQRDLVSSVFTAIESTGTGPRAEAADPWAGVERMNVLLIGSDGDADRIGVRPDTLILASIDTDSGDTVLFSLPRNLERVPFPAGTPGRKAWPDGFYCVRDGEHECLLNAVWQWAETAGRSYYRGKHPGLQATEDAVHGALGLPVDSYAMLNLRGFSQFINAIGGLRVNVDQRLPVGGDSENPVATSWIEPGRNKLLDGYNTLWYARSRWSTSDFDRMRRQRCVIGAVVQQADPLKLARAFPAIAKAAKTNLSTDIPQQDLQAWVELTMRVKRASVRSLPFTDEVVKDRSDPNYRQIRRLVDNAIRTSDRATPTPSSASGTGSTASPSGTSGKRSGTTSGSADPRKAQDVTAVC
jgi:LCP family protein required for cell wall assembly